MAKTKSKLTLEQWSQLTNPIRENLNSDWAAWLALGIAVVVVPYAGRPGINELPERAISTLYTRLKSDPNRPRAYATYVRQHQLMSQLISLVDQYHSELNQATLKSFIDIHLVTHRNKTLLARPGILVDSIPPLLRTLAKVPGHVSEIQTLLEVLENNIQALGWYMLPFVHSEGFSSLLQIKKHNEYQLIVAKCIARIVQSIAAKWTGDIKVKVVPGFFDAVSFALRALSSGHESSADLLSVMHGTTLSLRLLPINSLYSAACHPGITAVTSILRTEIDPSEEQASVLAELEELESWFDEDEGPLRGVAALFGRAEEVSTSLERLHDTFADNDTAALLR